MEVAQLLIGFVVTPEPQAPASEKVAAPSMHTEAGQMGAGNATRAAQRGSAERAASSAATSPMAAFLCGTSSVPKVRSAPDMCRVAPTLASLHPACLLQ